MTRRTRTILFLLFGFFFILAAPLVVLYSQGYRFDFERKKIVNTGGIYLRIRPPGVSIFIDGKFKRKTNILTNSVLIQNLLPKNHKILIKKEGYYPWEKTLEIKEKRVVKADNIILIKEKIDFKILKNNIENFFFFPDKKRLLLQKITKKGFTLEIFNSKEGNKKIFSFPTKNKKILSLKWSPDSKKALIVLSNFQYFVLELESEKKLNNQKPKELRGDIKEPSFHPKNSDEMFFIKNHNLYLSPLWELSLNPLKKKFKRKLILNNLISYKIFENNIIWLEKSGFVYRSDLTGNIIEVLNVKPLFINKIKNYKFVIQEKVIFLIEDDFLFFLNPKTKIFEKVYSSVKDLKFSPDAKKIVFFNDYEIWISKLNLPQFNKTFLARFSEKINNIFWLNNYYLIFYTCRIKSNSFKSKKCRIKISEIDIRDKVNIVDLTEFEISKIFWNQNNKKLYYLKKNTLFISEKLLP